MTNPWIEWSKQEPREEDFPIICGNSKCAQIYGHAEGLHYSHTVFTHWKHYRDAVPKPPATPDANGWWRIEDKEPVYGDEQLMRIENGNIVIGRPCNWLRVTHWKPIDMSGPVEEK